LKIKRISKKNVKIVSAGDHPDGVPFRNIGWREYTGQ